MKTNSRNLNGKVAACIIGVAVVVTACNDEMNDALSSGVALSEQSCSVGGADGTFVCFGSTDADNIGVCLNGSSAAVSRGASASAVRGMADNATVTYTNANGTEGYLTMNDSTMGVKKVAFCLSDDMMQLDFEGNKDLYNGGLVYLDKQGVTSRSDEGGYMDTANKIGYKLVQKLLENGAKAIGGDYGELVYNSFKDKLFTDSPDITQEKLDALKNQITELGNTISEMKDGLDKGEAAKAYRQHWQEIHYLDSHCKLCMKYIEENQNNMKGIKDKVTKWGDATLGDVSYPVYSCLMQQIEFYLNPYDMNHSWYDILDKYIFYCHDWESEGYEERDILRAYDLYTYIEALYLLKLYYVLNGYEGSVSDIDNFYVNTVKKKFVEQATYPRHENLAICQIPGAYVAMEKTVGIKTFGTQETYGDSGTEVGSIDDSYFECSKDGWVYSYVFSNSKIHDKKKELYSLCLTPNEAKTLYNKYNKECGSMYDILTKKVGITGLNDKNSIMILGARPYDNWEKNSGWSDFVFRCTPGNSGGLAEANINTHVWVNAENKYDGNYTVDHIKATRFHYSAFSLGLRFKEHNAGKWAYYTNVKCHYKDFDDLMKFEKEYK